RQAHGRVVSLGSLNQRAEIADQVAPPRFMGGAAIFAYRTAPSRLTSSISNTIGGAPSFEGWLGPPAAPKGMGRRLPAPASPRAHGQPKDIVGAMLFSASDDASWITVAVLPVDSGAMAGR